MNDSTARATSRPKRILSNRLEFVSCLLLVATLSVGVVLVNKAWLPRYSVRVLYVVPSDRTFHDEYRMAIEECVEHLQKWYSERMGERTFELKTPVVEVLHSSKSADWFSQNEPDASVDRRHYTTYNALHEVAKLVGRKVRADSFPLTHTDDHSVWLIYVDAPGETGAARNGYAILPDHDLRGLVGGATDHSPIRRWYGGSAHELGHAFGLLHPVGTYPTALMQKAYAAYPGCDLLPADVKTLDKSPFFNKQRFDIATVRDLWPLSGLFVALVVLTVLRIRRQAGTRTEDVAISGQSD